MRVFWMDEETGSGFMRVAKEGETLMDFVRETLRDEDTIRAMIHRWPDDDGSGPWATYEPKRWFKLEHASVAEYQEMWDELATEPHMVEDLSKRTDSIRYETYDWSRVPKILEVVVDAGVDDPYGSTLQWIMAEVPDDTRYVWYGGCTPTLEGWCGMGGNGYIGFDDDDEEMP